MFKNEVNYRLSKWLLAMLGSAGLITDSELNEAWRQMADYYKPPFLEVDTVGGKIGDGVIVSERQNG